MIAGPRLHRRTRATGTARRHFDDLLDQHLAGYQVPVHDVVGYLDYLGELGRFAFHGSGVCGLRELRTQRHSSDTRAFGRQQAVYASPDPHWAAFFAVVNREYAASIRNFSIALGPSSRTRWYRRQVVLTDRSQPAARPGWLYVLSRDGFRAEPRRYGLIDVAHWVSDDVVHPLFSLPLDPRTYPLARHIRAVQR